MLNTLRNDLADLKQKERELEINLHGTRGAIQYLEHLINHCEMTEASDSDYQFEPSLTETELAELVAGPGAQVVSIDACK